MIASIRCRIHRAAQAAATSLAVLAALTGATAQAATIYVTTTGNDANDGLTWATAKLTVQAGLDAAAAGDQVWVKAGTYVQCITLKAGAVLYGGFAGSETELAQRNWTANVAILDGNKAGSVVTVSSGATTATRIDGFTIRNGTGTGGGWVRGGGIICLYPSSPTIANNVISGNTASRGGGIYCPSSSAAIITNNTITDNWANPASGDPSPAGGGIHCDWSSPAITNNTITNNVALEGAGISCLGPSSAAITNNTITGNGRECLTSSGGGIWCSGSSPTIAGNVIAGNYAASCGSGVFCTRSSATIANNRITGNSVGYSGLGGGVYLRLGSPMVSNNVVSANMADRGSGIYCDSSSGKIVSNIITGNSSEGICCYSSLTITNNTILDNGSYGIYCGSGSSTIANTIIAFNYSGIGRDASANVALRCNCVYRNPQADYTGLTDPTGTDGNFSADPRFASASYGEMHIQPDSPCRDAGDDSIVQSDWMDMDGQARILGTHADIGADESDGTTWPSGPNRIVRVSPVGSDGNDGSSWLLAKRTVQAGIDTAAAAGGEVWVKAGVYQERITLQNFVHVLGGFSGTETLRQQRDFSSNPTVLDGGRAGNAVTILWGSADSSRIDGFTVRNGVAGAVQTGTGSRYGGGIHCAGSCATIANCIITGNSDSGIYCLHAAPMIVNSRIMANSSSGIYCYYSFPTIINDTITGNTAPSGGGIYCETSSPAITNTIVAFNSSGVCSSGSGTPLLRSDCVYRNFGGDYSGFPDPTGTNGNISTDPKLAWPFYVDVHIQPGSPCIDAGDDSAVAVDWLDMDNQPRKWGAHVDIGADESDETVWPSGSSVIVRVSPSGDDANDGSSWAKTKRTVQASLNAATPTGGDVWVAAGTYVETVTVPLGVSLYGGFAGSESDISQRNALAHPTVLDGNQAGSVVSAGVGVSSSTRIDGFIIRNGNADDGGGFYCRYSSPTISNNVITGNTAEYGGGIYCDYSSPIIANNTIAGNTGTGIDCRFSFATITNNIIMGNRGGGIDCTNSSPTIANSTIVGNSYGGAIYSYSSAPLITNTIVAFNSSGIYRYNVGSAAPVLRYSCVFGNASYNFSGLTDPTGTSGNVSADPRFVSAGAGADGVWGTADDTYDDLRLLGGSPCIDAGNNADVPADLADLNGNGNTTEPLPVDLGGISRFLDDPVTPNTGAGTPPIVDIGAYEYDPGLVGDVNTDGHVDILDLLAFATAWATTTQSGAYNAACDLNKDGSVNIVDLLYLADNWGK